jgi:hypothetical protein
MTAKAFKKSDKSQQALSRSQTERIPGETSLKINAHLRQSLTKVSTWRRREPQNYSITFPSGTEIKCSVPIEIQKEFEGELTEILARFAINQPAAVSSRRSGLEIFKISKPDPLMGKHESILNLIFEASEWYDSVTLCKLAGFSGANPSAQPHKWKKAGKIFALRRGNTDFYPSYAFGDDFRPLLAMKEILGVFHDKKSDLKIAAWFASENSWLRNQRPLDLILASPEAVIEAAEIEVSPIDHG